MSNYILTNFEGLFRSTETKNIESDPEIAVEAAKWEMMRSAAAQLAYMQYLGSVDINDEGQLVRQQPSADVSDYNYDVQKWVHENGEVEGVRQKIIDIFDAHGIDCESCDSGNFMLMAQELEIKLQGETSDVLPSLTAANIALGLDPYDRRSELHMPENWDEVFDLAEDTFYGLDQNEVSKEAAIHKLGRIEADLGWVQGLLDANVDHVRPWNDYDELSDAFQDFFGEQHMAGWFAGRIQELDTTFQPDPDASAVENASIYRSMLINGIAPNLSDLVRNDPAACAILEDGVDYFEPGEQTAYYNNFPEMLRRLEGDNTEVDLGWMGTALSMGAAILFEPADWAMTSYSIYQNIRNGRAGWGDALDAALMILPFANGWMDDVVFFRYSDDLGGGGGLNIPGFNHLDDLPAGVTNKLDNLGIELTQTWSSNYRVLAQKLDDGVDIETLILNMDEETLKFLAIQPTFFANLPVNSSDELVDFYVKTWSYNGKAVRKFNTSQDAGILRQMMAEASRADPDRYGDLAVTYWDEATKSWMNREGMIPHHIIQSNHADTQLLIQDLEEMGIHVNSAFNGVALDDAVHNYIHTADYRKAVEIALRHAVDSEDATEILYQIALEVNTLNNYVGSSPDEIQKAVQEITANIENIRLR